MLLLSSCSVDYHVRKAKNKGFRCSETTIVKRVPYFDTIRDEITNEIIRVDTMYVNKTKVVKQPVYLRMSRQERIALRDSMRHIESSLRLENARLRDSLRRVERTNRIEARQENRTERQENRQQGRTSRQWSRWWFALIIGLVVGRFVIIRYI